MIYHNIKLYLMQVFSLNGMEFDNKSTKCQGSLATCVQLPYLVTVFKTRDKTFFGQDHHQPNVVQCWT